MLSFTFEVIIFFALLKMILDTNISTATGSIYRKFHTSISTKVEFNVYLHFVIIFLPKSK